MSGGHFIEQCKHGVVFARCRCPGPHEVRTVECPPYHLQENYTPGDPYPVEVSDEALRLWSLGDQPSQIAAMRLVRADNPGLGMIDSRDALDRRTGIE